MEQGYAKFTLYFGLVNSDGFREGRFIVEPELNDTFNLERNSRALKKIDTYLQSNLGFGFEMGYNPFVNSNEDAEGLIVYSEKNIIGANGIIELNSCAHGKISFFRLIKFNGWYKKQEKELINKLKQSGYKPKLRITEQIIDSLINQTENKDEAEYLKKDLEQSIEKHWVDALKFY